MKARKPRYIPLLLLASILHATPAIAEIQTLEQALALVYQRDPGLQAERAKLRATDEQVSQALSNWRPSIDAVTDAGKNRTSVAGDTALSGDSILKPRDAGINVTQPVFRGLRTAGSVRSAEATVQAGRAALQDAEQKLLLDSATAYLDVLQGQEILDINRRNEEALRQELVMARDRFRIGELKKTDVNQAESRLKVAVAARLQASGELVNKRATFARLTGEMPGTLAKPELPRLQPGSMEEAVTIAQAKSPGVIAASYNREAAQADVQVAEGSLLPEVNLVGNATRSQDQNITLPQRQDSLSVMVKVTMPLYRSGADYSRTRAASQTLDQRDMELEDARRKAQETARNAWQGLVTAREVIAVDKEAVEANNQALYGVKEEAKAGTRTTLDVLNAEQELLNARVSLARAVHDEAVALLQVRQSIGALTAEALRLPVELYNPENNYDKVRGKWIGFGDAR